MQVLTKRVLLIISYLLQYLDKTCFPQISMQNLRCNQQDHNQHFENSFGGVFYFENTFKMISWLRLSHHSFIRYKMWSLYIEYLKFQIVCFYHNMISISSMLMCCSHRFQCVKVIFTQLLINVVLFRHISDQN